MTHVLTLIAAPPTSYVTSAILAAANAALAALGARPGPARWLATETACDIEFAGAGPAEVGRSLRRALAGETIDLAAQPAEGRRKALLVADLESTIVTQELTDELGALAGMGSRIAAITARAMRGEIDFAASLRERVALLEGQSTELLDKVTDRIEFTPGARALVQTMRANGAYTALVTGGFDCFARLAAEVCGFDEIRANRLVLHEGRLTGQVAEPIQDQHGKLQALQRLAGERGLPLGSALAIGDGANDIPMLQTAGLGIAFHGKPVVTAAARVRLDHADLTGALYLQGYHVEEFRH